MKSKKQIKKTRKKKNRRTKKNGGGITSSKLASKIRENERDNPLVTTSLTDALADIDAEPTDDVLEPTIVPTDDALEPTEDHAKIILPEPIPVEYGVPLDEVMSKLQLMGSSQETPSYKALGPYVKFIYAYFIKKYESPCFLYNDQKFKHRAVLHYNITLKELQFPENLGQQIRECIERGTEVIFITLYMKTTDKSIKHVNLLIYRPFKKVIEHYEPHGPMMNTQSSEYNFLDLNDKLKELFEVTLRPVLEEYTPKFKPASDLCPIEGFQGIESDLGKISDEDGYCQMWTMFLMETILLNPTQNTTNIIEECLEIGESNPLYFKQLIRGYRQKIAQELMIYFSKYVKTPIGTQEAIDTMFEIDYDELIEEMKEETRQRQRPLPRLQETYEYEMEHFTPIDIAFYIHFLKKRNIKIPTIDGDKEELLELMKEQQLPLDMLSELMYNTYFQQISKQEMTNLVFFSRLGKYLNITLDLTYPPHKIENAKERLKEKYPFFHLFYFDLEKAKKIKNVVDKSLDYYDDQEIASMYFFMKHLRRATSREETTNPIFINEGLNDKYVEELLAFLKPHRLSLYDFYLLMTDF